MQQQLRPLDHVPDSHGSAGRAQSAESLRGPLQTIPAREEEYGTEQLGRIGGFSLHGGGLPSGVSVNTRERKKLERICRYISRPALSAEAAGADRSGHGQKCLEECVPARPDRDGTTGRQSDTLCSIGAALRTIAGTAIA